MCAFDTEVQCQKDQIKSVFDFSISYKEVKYQHLRFCANAELLSVVKGRKCPVLFLYSLLFYSFKLTNMDIYVKISNARQPQQNVANQL